MDSAEFIRIQSELKLKNTELAVVLKVTKDTVANFRNRGKITGPTALAMRLLRKYPNEVKEYMV